MEQSLPITASPSSKLHRHAPRLEHLDGLRGLLCLIVVHHHFLCGFAPCRVFGPSAEWITDPSICIRDYSKGGVAAQVLQLMTAPLAAGSFAVATFFVMSGCALSLNLLRDQSGNNDKWRLAVAKRFFRLALPCCSAVVFAYVLGGLDLHERAAEHTQSNWLRLYHTKRPTKNPLVALVLQSLGGIWHGSSSLNNAIWTMRIELFGSYLVFLLVALIKDIKSSRRRTQLLAGVAALLLLPSPSVSNSLQVSLEVELVADPTINGTVVLSPSKHSRWLAKLQEQGRLNNMTFVTTQLRTWSLIGETEDGIILSSRNVSEARPAGNLHAHNIFAGKNIPPQLLDPNEVSITSQQLVQSAKWSSSKPFVWYVCFVAGVWIADSVANGQHHDAFALSRRASVGLYAIAYACSSYPFKHGAFLLDGNFLWRAMSKLSRATSVDAFMLYYILGASILVWLLVACEPKRARRVLASKPCRYLGQISFSLYLTHIPMLYTLTSALYIGVVDSRWFGQLQWANAVVFTLTLPCLIGTASAFERYVDRPSIRLSGKIGRWLLDMNASSRTKRDDA